MDRYTYQCSLRAAGWVEIGEGYYSTVYAKGDEVIKVGPGKKDDGGKAWALCALQHKEHNKHLPRVSSVTDHNPMTDDEFYSVRMERLSFPGFNNNKHREFVGKINDALWRRGSAFYRPSLPRAWQEVADLICEVKTTAKKRIDFHGGNALMREDGTMVVTDPIAD